MGELAGLLGFTTVLLAGARDEVLDFVSKLNT
jgi:hypothetical protein